ncbi:MAG: COX15/CtaA family protein [Candidatus Eremiobacteraeota bacterium]|nr:COX15/CtaA family protein [Candidatus Eremiobacteraeota bacterium]
MKNLWRLALTAALVAYVVAVLGSWVRINGAGMSCPSWGLCNGALFPSLAHGVLWEWSHRLLVVFEALLVATLMVTAWKERRVALIGPAAACVGTLFLFQVGLGAATVRLSNSPISVVMHWGTAMAFIASLVSLAIFARGAGRQPAQQVAGRRISLTLSMLACTSAVAFLTMCIGAYVSSSGAGLACQTIPGCAGNVVVYGSGQYVQMLHRFVAAGTLLLASATFALSWNASERVRWLAGLGLGLLFAQVLLGLANVVFSLPVALREAHAANAAAAFIVFIVATTVAAIENGSESVLEVRAG